MKSIIIFSLAALFAIIADNGSEPSRAVVAGDDPPVAIAAEWRTDDGLTLVDTLFEPVTEAEALATEGASGARRRTGQMTSSGAGSSAAALSASASSGSRTTPVSTGFITATRRPRARSAWMSAHATKVLPTFVSVPVTNTALTRP